MKMFSAIAMLLAIVQAGSSYASCKLRIYNLLCCAQVDLATGPLDFTTRSLNI